MTDIIVLLWVGCGAWAWLANLFEHPRVPLNALDFLMLPFVVALGPVSLLIKVLVKP